MYLQKTILLFVSILALTSSCECEESNDSGEFGEPMGPMKPNVPKMDIENDVEGSIMEPVLPETGPKSSKKTIDIRNLCSFDINLGFTGGYAGHAIDGNCARYQVNDGTDRCFWSIDIPDFLMSKESIEVDIEEQVDSEVIVSGSMYGIKSPYIGDVCPGGKCKPYQGPSGAVTLAEFTMLREGAVYFDVSNIHGISIPTSMGPREGDKSSDIDPYREGVAGECPWVFDPPEQYRIYLIEVKHAHGKCSVDTDCDQDEVCGSSYGNGPPEYGVCGEFYGYVSAHENCVSGSTGWPFFCETYRDLFGCAGMYAQSGYSNIEDSPSICGCSDYEDLDIVSAFPCVNSNPLWIEKVYKWVHFIKKGCPTSYIFAFDDSTSTFTSTSDDFSIVFCPGDSEDNFFM